eukprot:Trichotokara_eunicae@DN2431_c0_g1_i1.p1
MAAVPISELDPIRKQELACTYAALILHDDGSEITAEKIEKLISAAGAKVEPYFPGLFAKALKSCDVSALLTAVGSGGGGGGGGGGGAAGDGGAAAAAPEAEPEEEEEEEEEDMGFSLFG